MSSLVCKDCGETKPYSEVYADRQKKTGKQAHCKLCDNARRVKFEASRPGRKAKYIRERNKKFKLSAIEYKGGCCAICGLTDDPCVFDFHHIDPDQKLFNIGDPSYSVFDNVKDELDKCILICSNCHRKLHWSDECHH